MENDRTRFVYQLSSVRLMAVERGDRQLLNLLQRSMYELGPRQLAFAIKVQPICHRSSLHRGQVKSTKPLIASL